MEKVEKRSRDKKFEEIWTPLPTDTSDAVFHDWLEAIQWVKRMIKDCR